MKTLWKRTCAVLAGFGLVVGANGAWAFGDKPVKLIVPAPPGGTMDIVGRLVGHPQLQFVGWVGVIGPAKLPPAELGKIQAALQKAASAPAVQQKLFETGLEPQVNVDSAALARETREISGRNAGIVKKFGIKL